MSSPAIQDEALVQKLKILVANLSESRGKAALQEFFADNPGVIPKLSSSANTMWHEVANTIAGDASAMDVLASVYTERTMGAVCDAFTAAHGSRSERIAGAAALMERPLAAFNVA
jgi:hypothetical protein